MRKPFNTVINKDIALAYSRKCRENKERITDVTEALFYLYATGQIKLKKETKYYLKEGPK